MSGPRKYTVEEHGPRIRQFLEPVLAAAHLEMKFDVVAGRTIHPEIEDPHLMVQFSGLVRTLEHTRRPPRARPQRAFGRRAWQFQPSLG